MLSASEINFTNVLTKGYCPSDANFPSFSLYQAYCIRILLNPKSEREQFCDSNSCPYSWSVQILSQPSHGPSLVSVGNTVLCTRSRAAGLLGSEKSGTLVWSVHCMYLILRNAADSSKGLVMWILAIFCKVV